MTRISPSAVRSRDGRSRLHWRRALLATTAAISLGQNAAWATCLDGSSFPPRRLPDRRRAGGGRGQLVAERLHRDGRLLLHPGQLGHRSGHRRTHERRAQLGLRPGLDTLQGWRCRQRSRDHRVDPAAEHLHRLHRPADHQERQGDQPGRRAVPGFGRHPGLRHDQTEHRAGVQPVEHLRQPARLLDRRLQQRWRARGHH